MISRPNFMSRLSDERNIVGKSQNVFWVDEFCHPKILKPLCGGRFCKYFLTNLYELTPIPSPNTK
jgi:hypothetical protein